MKIKINMFHFLLADDGIHRMEFPAELGDPSSNLLVVRCPEPMLDHRAVARLRHLADEIEAYAAGHEAAK